MSGGTSTVVVVGGGVGGLAAAIRLSALGHRVSLFERNDTPGGKLASWHDAGYTFDLGPSLLTLPQVFEDLLAVAGTSLADELDLVRLDPQFVYRWSDGSRLVVHDAAADTARAFEEFASGAGDQWRRFDDRGRRIWDVSERTFFAGPMGSPLDLARRMRSPRDLPAIDPLRTLHRAATGVFEDSRLQQWVGRYATYSGSSPYRAPATLACIPHVEARYGCWYPIGGLGAVRSMLERIAGRMGVDLHTRSEVTRIAVAGDRVSGIELADGSRHIADHVVVNADAEHLYRDLLPDPRALRRVERAERSTSGFVLCLGVRDLTPGVQHHNVWFSDDYRSEFADLAAGRVPAQPTVYACVSSVTDPSQAPDGCENWFLLINTPAGTTVDRDLATDLVLGRLGAFGIELRTRTEVVHTLTPHDLATRYRAPGGAIYGTSSNGRRAAFIRPKNRGSRRNLHLVGGSSHPGGGLPLVTMSARIVADMIGAPS